MEIAQIWRYPVKSMAGERLEQARIGPLGIEGDRVVHVENEDGYVITSRTHHRLLGHHATLNASGEPVVDGLLWNDPKARKDVVDIVGPGAKLVRDDSSDRFDVLPLLVATDGAITAFGRDGRRLRPNLVIGGVEGLAERSWPGQCLHIGEVIIGIQDLRGRCIMTTFDPDSLKQDRQVLADIVRRFGGTLALNCFVIRGGEIRVGDTVELARRRECEMATG
ncbi:MAG: MOSC N-terminal beta barrel domain-containing protein [Nitrospira sp.]|nr:MOSC N-terminal beta barrel domain-containing protein [Nitrospira sp.]MDH4304543.1 MOSC N-terminal beta barrel domain-containing protein [Nitrospira sp.]MDH5194905.1 MOSC N-terminal beta barrel domain-containing protein [Nitrospira sp.]